MQKATIALVNWNRVQAFSLAGNFIRVITDDGRTEDFHYPNEEEARKAFNARSSGRMSALHEK